MRRKDLTFTIVLKWFWQKRKARGSVNDDELIHLQLLAITWMIMVLYLINRFLLWMKHQSMANIKWSITTKSSSYILLTFAHYQFWIRCFLNLLILIVSFFLNFHQILAFSLFVITSTLHFLEFRYFQIASFNAWIIWLTDPSHIVMILLRKWSCIRWEFTISTLACLRSWVITVRFFIKFNFIYDGFEEFIS